jgi:hypothetical protein
MENQYLMPRETSTQMSLQVMFKVMKYSLEMFQEEEATG